jgi:hypothetical protein
MSIASHTYPNGILTDQAVDGAFECILAGSDLTQSPEVQLSPLQAGMLAVAAEDIRPTAPAADSTHRLLGRIGWSAAPSVQQEAQPDDRDVIAYFEEGNISATGLWYVTKRLHKELIAGQKSQRISRLLQTRRPGEDPLTAAHSPLETAIHHVIEQAYGPAQSHMYFTPAIMPLIAGIAVEVAGGEGLKTVSVEVARRFMQGFPTKYTEQITYPAELQKLAKAIAAIQKESQEMTAAYAETFSEGSRNELSPQLAEAARALESDSIHTQAVQHYALMQAKRETVSLAARQSQQKTAVASEARRAAIARRKAARAELQQKQLSSPERYGFCSLWESEELLQAARTTQDTETLLTVVVALKERLPLLDAWEYPADRNNVKELRQRQAYIAYLARKGQDMWNDVREMLVTDVYNKAVAAKTSRMTPQLAVFIQQLHSEAVHDEPETTKKIDALQISLRQLATRRYAGRTPQKYSSKITDLFVAGYVHELLTEATEKAVKTAPREGLYEMLKAHRVRKLKTVAGRVPAALRGSLGVCFEGLPNL